MATGQPFTLEAPSSGAVLDGYLHAPAGDAPGPAIVAAHGFKGFMEWGFFPYLADLLSDRGFVFVRFNFSGAGMRPGDELVTDLEAFRRNTFTRELGELLDVLDATAVGRLAPGRVDPARLGLFGHSRGGGIALLAAAHPTWSGRLRALVTWAAVSTFERLGEPEQAEWRRRGWYPVINLRTGQELLLGTEILDDYAAHSPALDLAAAARRRGVPWLIVHGDQDETVPVDEARALAAAAAPPSELLIVPDGDHGLGGRHPFPGPQPPLIQALNATQTWFRKWL
ncbi:MAG TPA: prolyl oligopeptidase family serine peptidase [Thermoanaerobaculia bacterium]|nr:prolyl oligopeptidase family serine peptidase [Thermoanaerobaculia bacterium]